MRPIDADALREIVEGGLRNNPHTDGYARSCHRVEYAHFLDVICRMPTIAPPQNDPLTLEELREMDGEPVWVIFYASYGETVGMWALVSVDEYTREVFLTNRLGGRSVYEEAIVDIEAIYRRGTP